MFGFVLSLVVILGILAVAVCAPAMASAYNLADAATLLKRALPASTAAVTSPAWDRGYVTAQGVRTEECEWLLTAPAVTTAQLPDGKTFTYSILTSDNADLSSPAAFIPNVIVQTGAGGVGAATATYRFRLPSSGTGRYLFFTVTPSGSGTGDASAATATLVAMF